MKFAKFLRTPSVATFETEISTDANAEIAKNEAREIDCLCCGEVNAMLIASAKIPEHQGSISPCRFYG